MPPPWPAWATRSPAWTATPRWPPRQANAACPSSTPTSTTSPETPSDDLLDVWVAGHDSLHKGAAMLAALNRAGSDLTTVATPILWRLLDGRGGAWTEPATRVPEALNAIRRAEERRIAAGTLPAVGLLASVRR